MRQNQSSSRRQQSGLALIVALIALVAMTLAGLGLARTVDTATLIAGNLAFRQGAAISGDAGVEKALEWLSGATADTLKTDASASGYYATSQMSSDLTGNRSPGNDDDDVAWNGRGGRYTSICLAEDVAGNTACYIIHRLCDRTGVISSAECSVHQSGTGGGSSGSKRQMETYQQAGWTQVANMAYYRVTVRVDGPRNNVGFIQSFLVI
jgi:type IV pilus assembly protein PilX